VTPETPEIGTRVRIKVDVQGFDTAGVEGVVCGWERGNGFDLAVAIPTSHGEAALCFTDDEVEVP
jgi:hypothetical protein